MTYSLMRFSTINNRSLLVNRSNFTLICFKAAFYANPGAERRRAGSGPYISTQIFRKFSNTSSNNNLSV